MELLYMKSLHDRYTLDQVYHVTTRDIISLTKRYYEKGETFDEFPIVSLNVLTSKIGIPTMRRRTELNPLRKQFIISQVLH